MSQPSTQAPPAPPDVVLVLWNQSHDEDGDDEGEGERTDNADAPRPAPQDAEERPPEAAALDARQAHEQGPAHLRGAGDADATSPSVARAEESRPASRDDSEAPASGEADHGNTEEAGGDALKDADSEETEGETEREEEDEGEGEALPERIGIEAQAEAVVEALRERGISAASVDIEDDIDRVIDSIVLERPTIIYNLVDQYDGDATQHPAVASLLDLLGMPYTGSEPLALATCQDRARTRLLLDSAGVPVPGYAIVRDVNALPDTSALRPPLIVTQAFDDFYDEEGELQPIEDRETLEARLYELAREYDLPLLIEEYFAGRRLHAVVLGHRVLEVLPLCETHTDEDDEGRVSLAQLDSDTADRVRALAQRAFRAMGCRDLAQIDFHLKGGEVAVTDVRPSVDLSEGAPFGVAAGACEGGFGGVVYEIAKQALRRARPAEETSSPGTPGGGDAATAGATATLGPTGSASPESGASDEPR